MIYKLITYFLQDEGIAANLNIDLHKGLIITGPVGCGKTAIMRIMQTCLPRRRQFHILSCGQISREFIKEGDKAIERYITPHFEPDVCTQPLCCFDDLGLERDVSHFGNNTNVMAEILFHRYNYFLEHHMLTYITTNMESDELEERYGGRLRSRIRQMCNLINFSKDSKDKRQ